VNRYTDKFVGYDSGEGIGDKGGEAGEMKVYKKYIGGV
jgi:hypothetical protein